MVKFLLPPTQPVRVLVIHIIIAPTSLRCNHLDFDTYPPRHFEPHGYHGKSTRFLESKPVPSSEHVFTIYFLHPCMTPHDTWQYDYSTYIDRQTDRHSVREKERERARAPESLDSGIAQSSLDVLASLYYQQSGNAFPRWK